MRLHVPVDFSKLLGIRTSQLLAYVFLCINFLGFNFSFIPSKLCAEIFFAMFFFCTGFLLSQQFEKVSFVYEKQRTLTLVPGFQYEIQCTDNSVKPDWYYNGQIVTESNSAPVYQISNSANTKTLNFTAFSMDEVGKYTCSKSCGNCTIDIDSGKNYVVRV